MLCGETKQFELSGEGNSVVTNIDKYKCGEFSNCLMTSGVMESGKHRISFKITRGDVAIEYQEYEVYCGLARDGAAWNKDHGGAHLTDAWFIGNGGCFWGNGKEGERWRPSQTKIKDGDILSVEANLDEGTLRFWKNGKPHGPGWSSGVMGKVRWAVQIAYCGDSVQIVPTPELQLGYSPAVEKILD